MRLLPATTLLTLLGATVFGLVDALLWSSPGRNAAGVGTISATYLLLAFLAGWAVTARRSPLWFAAVMGLAVTFTALAVFYGWQVHHLTLSGHGARTGLARYGAGGALTGPLFGALGWVWSSRRSWWAVVPVGLAFILEPAAWRAYEGFQLIPEDVRRGEYAFGSLFLALSLVLIQSGLPLSVLTRRQSDH